MWSFSFSRNSSAKNAAREVPAPPVKEKPLKLTGIVVRREKASIKGYQSSGDRLYLAIRLHEGEGIGSKKDIVFYTVDVSDLQSWHAHIPLLEKGDQVTVLLKKNADGETEVLTVFTDPSQFVGSQRPQD